MTHRPILSLGGTTPTTQLFAYALLALGTKDAAVVDVEPESSLQLPEPVQYYWPSAAQEWTPTLTVPLAYSKADERRRRMGWKTDIQRPLDEDERKRAARKREKAARKQQRGQR